MRHKENEIDALGIRVAVVTFQAGVLDRAYVEETGLRWPLLVDESRELYKAYGMEHGRWWDLVGPATIGVYVKLMLRGRRLHRATGDVKQLGGDVLIDPEGIVRLHHVGSGPADRPSVESLLDAVRDEL